MKLRMLAILALLCGQSFAAQRPNVLMIFIDDLRPSLGCYGDPLVKSPNIDRFAQTARQFNRAYCHQAVCGPSRASILTGRLPDNTGVWHNRNLFRTTHPNLVTLPQLFKNHGWHAQGLGKIFSGDEREEDPQSWTVPTTLRAEGWRNYALPENNQRDGKGVPFERADVPDDGYPDGKLANLAVETLAKLKQQARPFFLGVGFFKPHLPFNAPKKYWDLYDPAVFALDGKPARTKGAPDVAYPDHLELAGYKGVPKDERVYGADARDLRHGYYACISYTDAQVGKVLAALKHLGLESNTIVVLLGDHGFSLGEADHWCKDTNFELDTRVPLMIRTPDLKQPGAVTEALTEHVDVYPTLAALAALPAPADLDGRSLIPILEDPHVSGRAVVLSQFSRPFKAGTPEVMGYSIRTDAHRYTRWIEWKTRKVIAEELYDYHSPHSVTKPAAFHIEQENVVNAPALASLHRQLSAKLDDVLGERIKPLVNNNPSDAPTKKKTKAKKRGSTAPDAIEARFETLFDGRSFTGWEHKGNWVIEDGAFHRKDKGGPLTYSVKPVPDDFELHFEWKVSTGCNSGVYYRPGQIEYQVLDNIGSPYGENPRQAAASLFFCMAPSKDVTRPVGEWNEGRVVCKGTVIQHWLNGEKVIDFDYTDPRWATQVELLRIRGADLDARGGMLWLQDHGAEVWFRNLRLRTIPAEEKLTRSAFTPMPVPPAALEKESARVKQMLKVKEKK